MVIDFEKSYKKQWCYETLKLAVKHARSSKHREYTLPETLVTYNGTC